MFKDKYKHLAIRSVWLIEKSKENNGFQVWHRDFWLGHEVMSTIVVNVGAITGSNKEGTMSRTVRVSVTSSIQNVEQLESVLLAKWG